MPPTVDRSVQQSFNNTGRVIDDRQQQNAQRHREEEFAKGDKSARLLSAEQAQVDLFKQAEFDQFQSDITKLRSKILTLLKLDKTPANKAKVQAAYDTLKNKVPAGQTNPLIFKGSYLKTDIRDARFSKALKDKIRALPAFQTWKVTLGEVFQPVKEYIGKRTVHPTPAEQPRIKRPRPPQHASRGAGGL
jgi:hypothetical protein